MQFGFMLSHQYLPHQDLGAGLEAGVRQTELCRDLGYEILLSHHHYLANLQTPQPIPVLAHLIPYSGTMRLGVGVYVASLDHPVQLAENFATLDQLSGGRLVMGVGVGYRQDEFVAFGIDLRTRFSRFEETLEILRRFWRGERVTFHGKHFAIDDQAISVVPIQQDPLPPVWIGANHPRSIRRAARLGDAWLASPNVRFKWANGNLASFKLELERLGVDPTAREYPIVREVYVADSDAAARAQVREFLEHEYNAIGAYDSTFKAAFEELFDKAFLVGSPDTVAERVALLDQAGWTTLIARSGFPGMPSELTHASLQRFAEAVMPQFRSAV